MQSINITGIESFKGMDREKEYIILWPSKPEFRGGKLYFYNWYPPTKIGK